jgi:VanZ family protein
MFAVWELWSSILLLVSSPAGSRRACRGGDHSGVPGPPICYEPRMSLKFLATCLKTLKAIGWLCVGLLVWLSWIPAELEVRTGMAGQIEHAMAYCGAGIILAFAYQEPRRWRIAAGLVVLAGMLEIGQLWVPGRTSQFIDFAASSVAAVVGVLVGRAALGSLVSWVMRPGRSYRRITTAGGVPSHLGGLARCGSGGDATVAAVATTIRSGRKRIATRSAQIRKVRMGRQRRSAAWVRQLRRATSPSANYGELFTNP